MANDGVNKLKNKGKALYETKGPKFEWPTVVEVAMAIKRRMLAGSVKNPETIVLSIAEVDGRQKGWAVADIAKAEIVGRVPTPAPTTCPTCKGMGEVYRCDFRALAIELLKQCRAARQALKEVQSGKGSGPQ